MLVASWAEQSQCLLILDTLQFILSQEQGMGGIETRGNLSAFPALLKHPLPPCILPLRPK